MAKRAARSKEEAAASAPGAAAGGAADADGAEAPADAAGVPGGAEGPAGAAGASSEASAEATPEAPASPFGEVSAATRKCMQGNKRRDTTPELKVRRMLRNLGFPGYRLDWKKAPGHPDIAYPGRKIALFVHGCTTQ